MKSKLLFILIFFIYFNNLFSFQYELSIAVITKDEEKYLKEWIDYHLLMGVEHFYVYDNNDHNKTVDALHPYIKEGTVEIIKWPNLWKDKLFSAGCQTEAYNHALKLAMNKTKWLAFIDTDEFIVPLKENTVIDALNKHYHSHGFIYVNWLMFGTGKVFVNPGEPLLPKLLKCAPKSDAGNTYGKTICRPHLTKYVEGPHFVNTKYPYLNGSGTLRKDNTHQSDILRINHYVLRDENFLRDVKIPRLANRYGYEKKKAEELYRAGNELYSQYFDYRILEVLGFNIKQLEGK